MHPISARPIKKKIVVEQSTKIEHDEIDIINIIIDKTYNLQNSVLNNGNKYMKVTLMFKLIGDVKELILADYHEF